MANREADDNNLQLTLTFQSSQLLLRCILTLLVFRESAPMI